MVPVPSIWSGALPAVRRAECREGARPRVSIDTRLALGASSEAPERARMVTTISQRWPCRLGRHVPPTGTDPRCGRRVAASETWCSRPRDIGTRRRCPTHSGERPTRHGHARLARRSTLSRVVAGYHPPTRTYVYHQHVTIKPSDLGESGWASCVARASRVCTKPPGRRVRHFEGRHRISYSSIRSPVGPRRPGRHGEVGGVLISILG